MNRPRPHRSRRPRGRGGHRPDRLRPLPRRRPAAVGQRPLQGRRRLPLHRQRSASPRASTRSRRRTSRSAPARPASCSRPTATATIRLQTMAKGGKPLFVGVARTARRRRLPARHLPQRGLRHRLRAVRARYAEHRRHPQPGAARRADLLGRHAAAHALTWDVQSGDWSVVVMNADGSRGVSAAVTRGRQGPVHRRDRLRHARPRPAVHHRHRRADGLRHAPGRAQARLASGRLARERADDLLPPGALARRWRRWPAAGARTPAARPTGRSPAAGRRRRSARPRAATSAPGSSRRVRSCSTTSWPAITFGRCGSPSPSCQGRIEVTDGRLRGRRARALLGADRPGAPAAHQLAELDRDLLAHEHVQLVALLDDRRAARRDRALAADDHVQQRLARQPELAHRVARRSRRRRAPGTASSPRRAGSAAPARPAARGSPPRRRSRPASARPARSSAPAARSRAARRRTRPGRSGRRAGCPR